MTLSAARSPRRTTRFLAVFAFVSMAVAACGRTDLTEDLIGVNAQEDAGLDGSLPDGTMQGGPDTGGVHPLDANPHKRDTGGGPPPGMDAQTIMDVQIRKVFDHIIDVPGNDTGTCVPNGTCDNGETCMTCPLDCGFCQSCGDGTCGPGETCTNCPQDCGSCSNCGTGFCDDGKDCISCPQDCGVCPGCGDGQCTGTENCTNCPADCGECMGCGDGHCSQNETCVSCPQDCGTCAVCGDGICHDGENCNNCPADCGSCPIAVTCQAILTCEEACFTGIGGHGGGDAGSSPFNFTCATECDANACDNAQFFANQAINCLLGTFIDGTCSFGGGGGGGLTCALGACMSDVEACLSQAPCPTDLDGGF